MPKTIILKQKINALLITIEVLNLYKKNKIYKNHNNIYQLKFILQTQNQMNFFSVLKNIQLIYQNSINTDIQQLVKYFIQCYKNNNLLNLNHAYVKKYIYLYNKSHLYYYNASSKIEDAICRTAIINLYIINQISKKYGIYFLLKYLYL